MAILFYDKHRINDERVIIFRTHTLHYEVLMHFAWVLKCIAEKLSHHSAEQYYFLEIIQRNSINLI